MRLWIDTDVGSDVDDALTLAYALRHPDIELVGVSTVFGDVALRTRIAEALLALAGAQGVPVVTGLGAPLTAERAGHMFGHEGRGLLDDAAPRMRVDRDDEPAARTDALAVALATARPDACLAIGPMTNLGALARAGHVLPPLTVMGGKLADVEIPGTLHHIPEWNWWCDPDAVVAVLGASPPTLAPPRVVPIEVTMRTLLPEEEWGRLAGGDELARALARLCTEWLEVQRTRFKSKRPSVHLHDPLAAMTLVEPDVCRFEPVKIRLDSGAVAHMEPTGAAIEAARDVDLPRLNAGLLQAWLGENAG